MARGQNRISDKQVRSIRKPGRYGDGGGLYLQVGPSGSQAWIFMWKVGTKRTAMGLGPYPEVRLAEARDKAAECRRLVTVIPLRSVAMRSASQHLPKLSMHFLMISVYPRGGTPNTAPNGA